MQIHVLDYCAVIDLDNMYRNNVTLNIEKFSQGQI